MFRLPENRSKHIANNFVTGIAIGLFAGIFVCLYRYLIKLCNTALNNYIFPLLHEGSPLNLLSWAVGLVALAFIVHKLIRFEPDAKGGGIPHAIKEAEGSSDSRWWSVILSKITAAPLCILAGFSLGTTGPSIEIGAMAGKGIGTAMGNISNKDKTGGKPGENKLSAYAYAGSAAGLSALFNAPLGGMWFACEKLHNTKEFPGIVTLISCFTATLVSVMVFGGAPTVSCHLPLADWKIYVGSAILGIFMGSLGYLYSRSLSFATKKLSDGKIPELPLWIAAFLIAGVVGYFIPEITGGGLNMLAIVSDSSALFGTLLFLLLGKCLFSVFSSGSGLPGGTVFPLLTVSACMGQLFGMSADWLFPSLGINPAIFILPAMAGFFTSVIGAPITGMFFLCEFSGDYKNLPPLILVCVISHLIAKRLDTSFTKKV